MNSLLRVLIRPNSLYLLIIYCFKNLWKWLSQNKLNKNQMLIINRWTIKAYFVQIKLLLSKSMNSPGKKWRHLWLWIQVKTKITSARLILQVWRQVLENHLSTVWFNRLLLLNKNILLWISSHMVIFKIITNNRIYW